jgi:murein DD-endopeptidase MepM/ murein hydrolase activator NlpD
MRIKLPLVLVASVSHFLILTSLGCKQSIPGGSAVAPVGTLAAAATPWSVPSSLPLPMATLGAVASAMPLPNPAVQQGLPSKEYFPTKTQQGFCEGAGDGVGAFGAGRGGGRLHGACDIYNPEGTPIYAVADGTVLDDGYPFYCSTDALEVDHGTYLVRYGEIRPGSAALKKGQKVKAGQLLAKTGLLDCYHQPMLHFEMYSGKASGSLGGNGGPYQRRSDLVNPTNWLKQRLSKKPP